MRSDQTALALVLGVLLLLVACAPSTTGNLEPAAKPPTIGATRVLDPTPLPQPSPSPPPSPTPLPAPTRTPPGHVPPTLAPDETPPPRATVTPLPPPPRLYYRTDDGLWRIDERWQPEKISDHANALPAPDGHALLIPEAGSLWLIDPTSNDGFPLASLAVEEICCARRWPGRPERLLVGLNPGLSNGQTAVIRLTDGALLWRAEGADSFGSPAGEPGGRRIAFDMAGVPWLWDEEAGASPLDPVAFGLPVEMRFGSPAWSPDGRYLAWAVSGPVGGRTQAAIAILDMVNQSAEIRHPYEPLGRGGWFGAPAWSPDGRYIAFVAEDVAAGRYGLWMLAAEDPKEWFVDYASPWQPILWSDDGHWLVYQGTRDGSPAGEPAHWFVLAESWYRHLLDLAGDAIIVDWQ